MNTTNKKLSPSEIRQYHEDGYPIPKLRLSDLQLNQLKLAVERVLEANRGIRPEHLFSVHLERLNDEGVRGDQTFFELASNPLILDCVEQVMGADIILWGCQLFCKPGSDGMEVPMHQDGNYWPIRPLATCTAWVAIDESSLANGCMKVLSGSHRDGVSYKHRKDEREKLAFNQKIEDERVSYEQSIPLELDQGCFSLHDIHLVHGSAANSSGRRRARVTIR